MAICREVDRSGGLILYELHIKPIQLSLNEDHYSLNITGLLQQTITWYKIRHTGGHASSLLLPHWDVKTKRPQSLKFDLPLF